MKKHVAMYGSLKLYRAYCRSCQDYAIIRSGKLLCCDTEVGGKASYGKVMSKACGERKKPGKDLQISILSKQQNKCLYCSYPFGTQYWDEKYKKIRELTPCWDHRIPFSYLQDNPDSNWVAACYMCNGIKSNMMFQTTQEAIDYVQHRRAKKGIKEEDFIL